jgi:UDP-GlcNAc:undecaprenyl-phosphate/decaprenyl-phosphate GlcNAc-1-phosphate transferase
MYSLVFLGIFSFFLSLVLTPVVRNAFRRWGIVDHPDDVRRVHDYPIPRVGGVAIVFAYLLSFAALFAIKFKAGFLIQNSLGLRLFPAAALVFTAGLVDDLRSLKPWQKLLAEFVAAGLACMAGVRIEAFGGFHIGYYWSFPLTIFWLVACTNAVNLIDGIDGLAAGVGLFATSTMLLAALLQNNIVLALAVVPLAGCLLGFLRYNFNPATIFLGDSGSLFVGFLLGCYGVLWSQKAATILGMTAPLMALAIPLLDTGLAIARRFLRHQPIFGADRGHIHHRLLDRGLTPRKAALILYACCALGACFSLFVMNRNLSSLVIVVFCLITWIGVQHLGYIEFGVASRMFVEGAFRRLLRSQIALQTYEDRLNAAATADEYWKIMEAALKEFGFCSAHMSLGGHTFVWRDNVQPDSAWDITIPISDSDVIHLARPFGVSGQPNVVCSLPDILRKTLTAKRFADVSAGASYQVVAGRAD